MKCISFLYCRAGIVSESFYFHMQIQINMILSIVVTLISIIGTSCATKSNIAFITDGKGFEKAEIPGWKECKSCLGSSNCALILYSNSPWKLKVLSYPFPLSYRPHVVAKSVFFNQRKDVHPRTPQIRLLTKEIINGQDVKIYSRHEGWLIEDSPSLIASYIQGGKSVVAVAAVGVPYGEERQAIKDMKFLISSMMNWHIRHVDN